MTLVNAETGNQVTRWVYGTTLSDSDIARNDLLRAKIYPESDDSHDPVGDGWDATYQRIEYSYNRQGQIETKKDPNETVHTYSFDKLGRSVDDEVTAFGSGIDETVKRIATEYEVRGMTSKVTSYDAADAVLNEVGYTYSDFGQLSEDAQSHSGVVDGSTPKVSYAYEDGSGNTTRRTSMTYPDGRVIDYYYGIDSLDDVLSRVASLKVNGEGQNLVDYTYVGASRYVEIGYAEPSIELSYIANSGEPQRDSGDPYVGYDRFGRTVDMNWQTDDETAELDRIQYGYDRSGNRTWRKNLAAPSGQDEAYQYDDLYQVTDFARGNLNLNQTAIGGIPALEENFDYDATGNWERYTSSADGLETLDQSRVNNQDNQITQIDGNNDGILYDKAGQATQMPPDVSGDWAKYYNLNWDGWGRLVEVKDESASTVATYEYDGTTRRIVRTTGGTENHSYYNQSWKAIEDREDSSTDASRQYLWGARPNHRDELIRRDRDTDGNGTLDESLYCLMDYYDPTSVVDTSGVVQERYQFSAFGLREITDEDWVEQSSSSYDIDFGFHGQFLDPETGYYNYGYRYYSPQIGRWLSKDPIEEQGGGNLYGFVENNAINGNDLLGLKIQTTEADYEAEGKRLWQEADEKDGGNGEGTACHWVKFWKENWEIITQNSTCANNIIQDLRNSEAFKLFSDGGYEEGGWLVSDGGCLVFSGWPPDPQSTSRIASVFPIPKEAVGDIHTHPDGSKPTITKPGDVFQPPGGADYFTYSTRAAWISVGGYDAPYRVDLNAFVLANSHPAMRVNQVVLYKVQWEVRVHSDGKADRAKLLYSESQL